MARRSVNGGCSLIRGLFSHRKRRRRIPPDRTQGAGFDPDHPSGACQFFGQGSATTLYWRHASAVCAHSTARLDFPIWKILPPAPAPGLSWRQVQHRGSPAVKACAGVAFPLTSIACRGGQCLTGACLCDWAAACFESARREVCLAPEPVQLVCAATRHGVAKATRCRIRRASPTGLGSAGIASSPMGR